MLCLACERVSYILKRVNDYTLRKCESCGLEFCWPMPAEEVLDSFYARYKDRRATPEVSAVNARRHLEYLNPTGRILDVGCGNGVFVSEARDRGLDALGIDRFSPRDYGVGFDWITMWGVLEHLTYPHLTLLDLHSRLFDKGRIALTTVSIETPIPYRHKPPEHTLYFTTASILALAERAGFKVIEYRPYTMMQHSDVYLETLLRTMPDWHRKHVSHSMPQYVEIPTNEVFVVLEKCQAH